MKFENTKTSNFQGAFRGMRNPLESWNQSDSYFGITSFQETDPISQIAVLWTDKTDLPWGSKEYYDKIDQYFDWLLNNCVLNINMDEDVAELACIGPKDMDLAKRLVAAGTSDSKFLRQIGVSVDITAPLYFWKQFDTYKVGTVANSTSTMHKLSSTPIDISCFETDDFAKDEVLFSAIDEEHPALKIKDLADTFIIYCEALRCKYNQTKDKKYWKELIRWLPNGWLQTRTVTLNYAVLRNIYFQRKNHRLSEWHTFCDWVNTLPYAADLITYNKTKN